MIWIDEMLCIFDNDKKWSIQNGKSHEKSSVICKGGMNLDYRRRGRLPVWFLFAIEVRYIDIYRELKDNFDWSDYYIQWMLDRTTPNKPNFLNLKSFDA